MSRSPPLAAGALIRSAIDVPLILCLAGCGLVPRAAEEPSAAAPQAASAASAASMPIDAETWQRSAAERAEQEGELARAALGWEALTLLRPEQAYYADQLAKVQQRIRSGVAEAWQQARSARQRGETDRASSAALRVLLLDPQHVEAARLLRQIEAERNRRGPLAKVPRPGVAGAGMEPRPAQSERNTLEHAGLLLNQGDPDAAIDLLERLPSATGRSPTEVRQLLAEAWFQRAERQLPKARSEALKSLEKALSLDPGHTRARQRQEELLREPAGRRPAASSPR
ncbi:MAG: hypothetical protein RJA44_12 [Pseudomonadota bacterium]|jgi:tetratricopeptide (TPR) repeat protein